MTHHGKTDKELQQTLEALSRLYNMSVVLCMIDGEDTVFVHNSLSTTREQRLHIAENMQLQVEYELLEGQVEEEGKQKDANNG